MLGLSTAICWSIGDDVFLLIYKNEVIIKILKCFWAKGLGVSVWVSDRGWEK